MQGNLTEKVFITGGSELKGCQGTDTILYMLRTFDHGKQYSIKLPIESTRPASLDFPGLLPEVPDQYQYLP